VACPGLAAQVSEWLLEWWSPAQIASRLRSDFPHDPMMWVSYETIYQSLFVQGRGELRRELTRCLRSGRAQRRPRTRLKPTGQLCDMVMISDRPAEAGDRAVPGHWEGDLIMGKDNRSAVGTLVERATRYVMLPHLPDGRGASQVRAAMTDAIKGLPEHLWRSITWDQGKEMAEHVQFGVDTGVQIYFCDPHAPWQRGSNENTNGLLRQWMPKGTDLSVFSSQDLNRIAYTLNNRPRQTLGWMNHQRSSPSLLRSPLESAAPAGAPILTPGPRRLLIGQSCGRTKVRRAPKPVQIKPFWGLDKPFHTRPTSVAPTGGWCY
jgi:IS30 family transposase